MAERTSQRPLDPLAGGSRGPLPPQGHRRALHVGRVLCSGVLLSLLLSPQLTAIEPTPIKPVPSTAFRPVLPTYAPELTPSPDTTDRTLSVDPRPTTRPIIAQPVPKPVVIAVEPKSVTTTTGWNHDREVSWYGPGFYGNRTACGLAYTKTILGVAHRSLPCGTLVEFRNPDNGRTAIVPVIDRGPYVADRQWDLSGGLCVKLDHCYTGPIDWRMP
jgi:rare lipoprotein A (peptidoglycan hydrolase)